MIEQTGDLWRQQYANAIVITTNGDVRHDGNAVMGRGIALEAANRFYGFSKTFGDRLKSEGNRVSAFRASFLNGYTDRTNNFDWVVTFPVKHHWSQAADPDLIEISCRQLRCITEGMGWTRVIMPRPGCGNGQLDWVDVKPILEKYLGQDRYEVFTNGT